MRWRAIVGQNVKACRLAAGLSQEELAHRAGLTPSYVGQVERGARNVGIEALGAMADALSVPLTRLVQHGQLPVSNSI